MGSRQPKQYLPLVGRAVIEWAAAPLLARAECHRLIVALAVDDVDFGSLPLASHPKVQQVVGGGERADSVRAGLHALSGEARDEDWVLVHDAARPCVSDAELSELVRQLQDDPVGGLLACPVVDTLKRGVDERVLATVPRADLWRALTPQMFRYGVLNEALRRSRDQPVTDESQAVEALGMQPRLIRGSDDNLKVTYPEDLQRAARILQSRTRTV